MTLDVDLLSLALYVDTVRTGSLSKAAALHQLSQPSASARIRALERQLGLRLLDRSPKGSVPTPSGRLVVEWAVDVLAAVERLRAGVDAVKGRARQRLRIAASYTVAEYLLPRWLAALRDEIPVGRIQLDVANSAAVLERVLAGEVDLGFVECPVVPPTVSTEVVARDELVVVVPPGHPWADADTVTLPMLTAEPLIVREEGSGTREALQQAVDTAGVSLRAPALELGSTTSVKAAVRDGAGAAVLSDLAVTAEARSGAVAVRRVAGLDLTRDLRAVWPRGRSLGEDAGHLLRVIGQAPAAHGSRGAGRARRSRGPARTGARSPSRR